MKHPPPPELNVEHPLEVHDAVHFFCPFATTYFAALNIEDGGERGLCNFASKTTPEVDRNNYKFKLSILFVHHRYPKLSKNNCAMVADC